MGTDASGPNSALMLPEPAQKLIVHLLRDYTSVRITVVTLMAPPSWRVMSHDP